MTVGGLIVARGRTSQGTPADGHHGWRPTSAYTAAIATGVLLLTTSLLAGRADIALIGIPGLLAATWAHTTRPTTPLRATLHEPPGTTTPGELAATLHLTTTPDTGPTADVIHLRITATGHRDTHLALTARATEDPAGSTTGRQVPLRLSSVRTGPQETFTVDLRGSRHRTWEEEPTQVRGATRLVLPGAAPLGRLPLPRRLRGLTGPHSSRRLGDGTELRDIHPFTPGDRLRRIDWRTTARRSPELDTLYVRRTYSTAEATAVLVVDSRDEVGPDIRTWRGYGTLRVDEPTSLDLARHAAASVATALVDAGDRVGLEDLARRRRPLPPAAGRRHLRRLVHGLALAHPKDPASLHRVRPPQLPADAIVYLFTTLLDDEPLHLVRTWHTMGHPVVVIDTLPDVRHVLEHHLAIAWRIARLEREDRITALDGEGAPVISWAGSRRDQATVRFEALARATQRHVPGRIP
ncbi:DUF58 domain-containing protein [Promicromonospora iranensis]|uniref:Uncharacterized protein (DUF58 family) n=1 Tax=Promicromonospora iranensis TaxID=1105144 RepID=A0ABU2CGX2_9MICO|nr:DUF58 domain-containing protein [Promicromonospora iranensis]MDR7380569.1 uncharacterized protein (DUF58 family) [Promicromonospora iranensis]